MTDWHLIKYSLNWRDKSTLQRDCLGLAIVIVFNPGLLALIFTRRATMKTLILVLFALVFSAATALGQEAGGRKQEGGATLSDSRLPTPDSRLPQSAIRNPKSEIHQGPCTTDAIGQHFGDCSLFQKHKFEVALAAFTGAAIYDGVRSTQKINSGRYYEANALLRSRNGGLSVPKFVALNAGSVALSYWLKRKHHSTLASVLLFVGAGMHVVGASR